MAWAAYASRVSDAACVADLSSLWISGALEPQGFALLLLRNVGYARVSGLPTGMVLDIMRSVGRSLRTHDPYESQELIFLSFSISTSFESRVVLQLVGNRIGHPRASIFGQWGFDSRILERPLRFSRNFRWFQPL